MAMKRGKTIAGVAAALGLTAVVLWLRDFIRFLRGDGRERRLQIDNQRRLTQARLGQARLGQTRLNTAPIPASGGAVSGGAVSGGAASSGAVSGGAVSGGAVSGGGRQTGTTAVETAPLETAPSAIDTPVIAPAPEHESPLLESMSDALVQYLITLHNLVVLARSRRKEAAAQTGGSSLTPEDWQSIDQQLRSLEAQFPQYDPDVLRTNYAQRHVYLLLHKVRGAMYSTRLSDEELFRIYGEVRSEACPVLDETPSSGEDYQFVRSLYDCNS